VKNNLIITLQCLQYRQNGTVEKYSTAKKTVRHGKSTYYQEHGTATLFLRCPLHGTVGSLATCLVRWLGSIGVGEVTALHWFECYLFSRLIWALGSSTFTLL